MEQTKIEIIQTWYPSLKSQEEIKQMYALWDSVKSLINETKDGTLEITIRDHHLFRISKKNDIFPNTDLTAFLD